MGVMNPIAFVSPIAFVRSYGNVRSGKKSGKVLEKSGNLYSKLRRNPALNNISLVSFWCS